jgi:Tfp pilus assembly protein PilO
MNQILSIGAFVLTLGIVFGYIQPTWSGSIKESKMSIANTEQSLATAELYLAQQNQLASARNAISEERLKQLELFLPNSVDNVGLTLDLHALAGRSGVTLSNIDVSLPGGSDQAESGNAFVLPTVGSLNLSLTAIGTYTAFHTFLRNIERSARLLDVQDISVKGSETGVYEYQVTMRLYWLQ